MERDTLLLRSDLEVDAMTEEERHNVAEQILTATGHWLRQADTALADLENDSSILGTTIVRASQNMANAIGGLAEQIDRQTEQERQALAQACLDDMQQHSLLLRHHETNNDHRSQNGSIENQNVTRDDMAQAIQAAAELLRDVEATLRAIDQDEADEIADVALTLAHLFVMSLQSLHETITPGDLIQAADDATGTRSLQPSTQIEILEDTTGTADDENQDPAGSPKQKSRSTTSRDPSYQKNNNSRNKKRLDRLRVLWPPLGPTVTSAFNWGKEEASKQPILAVALGITLWPIAVTTAVVGTPLVLVDGFVQDLYHNFQDGPLIQGVERTAAQLYHSARLTVLCGKLVGKQSLRIAKRQVKRHGGVEKIAQDVGHMAVDRLTHPVETAGMAWNAVVLGAGAIKDTWDHFQNEYAETQRQVQELQQF